MGKLHAIEGAVMVCSCGSTQALLLATGRRVRYGGNWAANILDHLPNQNIPPFGRCSKRNGGCVPDTPSPWIPILPTVHLGQPVPGISEAATLVCSEGGTITIVYGGQNIVRIANPPRRGGVCGPMPPGSAQGGGAFACGADAGGPSACGAAAGACGAAATGASACGAAANACGAAATGGYACGAAAGACGAEAMGAGACGAAASACGAAAAGAAACGVAVGACGGQATGATACGVAVGACGVDVSGAEACGVATPCGADGCGADGCAVDVTVLDACLVDVCAVDIVPVVPFI